MENKYITVAYRLYAIADGKKELLEEATVEHPFISSSLFQVSDIHSINLKKKLQL